MNYSEIAIKTLISGAPSFIVILIALYVVNTQKSRFYGVFNLGLTLMLFSSLSAVPLTELVVHNQWFSTPEEFAFAAAALDMVYAAGLALCVFSFHKRGQYA